MAISKKTEELDSVVFDSYEFICISLRKYENIEYFRSIAKKMLENHPDPKRVEAYLNAVQTIMRHRRIPIDPNYKGTLNVQGDGKIYIWDEDRYLTVVKD